MLQIWDIFIDTYISLYMMILELFGTLSSGVLYVLALLTFITCLSIYN